MSFGGALAGPALALPITCLLVAVAALFPPPQAATTVAASIKNARARFITYPLLMSRVADEATGATCGF